MNTRVYFIGNARLVKIGVSDNPRARLSVLQTSNAGRIALLAEMPGDERYERALHAVFAEYRVRGEWFRRKGRLAEFISLLPVMRDDARPQRRDVADRVVADAAESIAITEPFWAAWLPLVRAAVLRVGVDVFASQVGASESDVHRSLNERGRHFRLDWFMRLVSLLDRESAIALVRPLAAHLGVEPIADTLEGRP